MVTIYPWLLVPGLCSSTHSPVPLVPPTERGGKQHSCITKHLWRMKHPHLVWERSRSRSEVDCVLSFSGWHLSRVTECSEFENFRHLLFVLSIAQAHWTAPTTHAPTRTLSGQKDGGEDTVTSQRQRSIRGKRERKGARMETITIDLAYVRRSHDIAFFPCIRGRTLAIG